ncbi:Phosphoglycerate mutase family protein [Raphanus sativus]|nr:Phosphoglycerate mutase family protein [Raphanus sativus]
MESAKAKINGHQNVIVMRHGDRADKREPLWVVTAVRPWDPPLVHEGKVQAFQTGQRIRSEVGFPIHRVIVSPFLRCIQTAAEVVAALSAVDFDHNAVSSKDVPSVDNSSLKLPQWEESVEDFKERYVGTLKVLADKYPSENLLLITHWTGVGTILCKYFKDATKYLVDYCGSVELRRQVSKSNESEEFEVITSHGVSFKDNKVPIHGPVIT